MNTLSEEVGERLGENSGSGGNDGRLELMKTLHQHIKFSKTVQLQMYRPGSIYIISLCWFLIFSNSMKFIFLIRILYSEFSTLSARTLELHLWLRCYQFIEHVNIHVEGMAGTMELLLIMYMLLLEDHFVLRHLRNDG